MKRRSILALVVVALAAITFLIAHRVATAPLRSLAEQSGRELAWLAREFQLSPEQAQQIAALHATYAPHCEEMCRRIAENRAQLDRVISTHRERTPEMDAILRASAEIDAECRSAMLAHIYAVAAAMSPEQGQRYIAWMKPQILRPGMPHAPPAQPHHE